MSILVPIGGCAKSFDVEAVDFRGQVGDGTRINVVSCRTDGRFEPEIPYFVIQDQVVDQIGISITINSCGCRSGSMVVAKKLYRLCQ